MTTEAAASSRLPTRHAPSPLESDKNDMKKASLPYWPVVSRTLTAIVGGYALTYCFTAALARLLPLDRFDATLVASLVSFIIYLAFILWVFATHSLRRVATSLLVIPPLALIGFWPQLLERLG